jgi:preprotein translocase subunit SecF
MKSLFLILLLILSAQAWAASCDEFTGCKVLQCELERDIAEALRQGQPLRAADMQETLDRSRKNCTDVKSTTRSSTQQNQVQYRQQEVLDAKNADNEVKEQKKKLRLDEEMAELEKLRTKGTTPSP